MRRLAMRIQQAEDELRGLEYSFLEWVQHRRRRDPTDQHEPQLRTLEASVCGGVAIARDELGSARKQTDAGSVYELARVTEERAVFLRRVWEFFRTKFDQRDGEHEAVLRAADEVTWSCWAPVFRAAGMETPAPSPLPYVEPCFTPRAILRANPPPELLHRDGPLSRVVSGLPVSVIGLPPVSIARPWWLVFIAHETAHHLHRELFGDDLEPMREVIGQSRARSWAGWHEEVFADAVSVLLCGSAATWALAELVHGPEAALAEDGADYPSPLVRRAMMKGVLEAVGVAAADGVPPVPAADAPATPAGLRLRLLADEARNVGRDLVGMRLSTGRTLLELCVPDPDALRAGGEISEWRDEYAAGREPSPRATGEAARRAVAGAVAAWQRLTDDRYDPGTDAKGLCAAVLKTLPTCRPDDTRGGATPGRVPAVPEVLKVELLADQPLLENA